jgi:uncharacterized metal-binding protein
MSDCCGGKKGSGIYSCSGAADTGFISDRVARMLAVAGHGSMSCLAGLGGDIESFVKAASESERNIVIDGCPVRCGKKIFDRHGVPCESYVVTEFGFKKGETGMSEELVRYAFMKINGAVETKTQAGNVQSSGGSSCSCGGKC